MGITKKMQMLHAEFEAAIEDRDADSVLDSAPEILAELDRFRKYYEQQKAENERLRLTDAERTAIQRLIEDYEGDGEPASEGVVATLRGLLERQGGER